jgi:hypothetical protein
MAKLTPRIEQARAYLKKLESNFNLLMEMPPIKVGGPLPADVPECAIYVLSGIDNGEYRVLYVGRTDRLKRRLRYHHGPGSDANAASFAFLLAREATGMLKEKRAAWLADRNFMNEFIRAKTVIREMDLRYFEETDAVGQALLEIFTAVATDAKHNSFKNH